MNLTDENIKPVPKYMAALIQRTDKKAYPKPCGSARFYAYLTKMQGELVKVTVAVKHYRKKWYCKPVAWHGIHSDKCLVKDLEYCGFVGLGFRIGWHEEGLQSYRKWFERGVCYADDKYYDPWAEIVNPEFVEKFPEYKYSAYKLFRGVDLLKYLRRYERYPQLEMLMKLGFEKIAMSVTILKRVGKDKNFCRWDRKVSRLPAILLGIPVTFAARSLPRPCQRSVPDGERNARFLRIYFRQKNKPAHISGLSQSL